MGGAHARSRIHRRPSDGGRCDGLSAPKRAVVVGFKVAVNGVAPILPSKNLASEIVCASVMPARGYDRSPTLKKILITVLMWTGGTEAAPFLPRFTGL